MSRAAGFIAFAFAATLGGLIGMLAVGGGVAPGSAVRDGGAAPPSFADIVERVNPAVVNISVVDSVSSNPHEGIEAAPALELPQRGEGSGFIVDPSGFILTNHHLVNGTSRIRVRLADRNERSATLVGSDPSTDIALIKVEGAKLPFVRLGDSDRLRVGDWVCAIGNPYSFDHTVTAGVVSSKGRKIFNASFDAYIQTDAAINPGNSGGPLLNASGEAVGINTAVSSEGQGIGFAVPINVAREVMEQLKASGHVARGYLGIQLQEIDPDLQKLLGLHEARGAMVLDVLPGHAGESAGLKRYDVITDVGGRRVDDGDQLVRTVAANPPGSKVTLSVIRDGRELKLKAELADRAVDEERQPVASASPAVAPASHGDALGLEVTDMGRRLRRELGIPAGRAGVVVRDVLGLSPALDELAHGDLVVELNRKPTPDLDTYRKALAALAPGDVAWLLVYRPRPESTFLVKLEAEAK
jgi:serine protease Do